MKKSKLHAKTHSYPYLDKPRVKAPARSWIEQTFYKRECSKFIPTSKDQSRCCCGRLLDQHKHLVDKNPPQSGEIWYPSKCTIPSPTDAYGILEFQGGPHPAKAQYIRVAHDTRPEHLLYLIVREWNLELPKLLISIQGGKANFELQPKLKKILRKGLLKAARSTEAWIFTGGTNTGVTKHIGDALLLQRSQRTGRVVTLGIAPWGIVENNQDLIGRNTEVPYHSISSPRSKCAALNNRHSYFLLVDNGTVGKYGAEIILRRRLERHISKQRLYPFTQSPIPIVCLVIEGGANTIRAVYEYISDDPPVPVVVCDGSGRAADIIAFMVKYEYQILKSMKDYIVITIQKAFEIGKELAEALFGELMRIVEIKHMITVFRITEKYDQKSKELDQTILTALFKSQHLSPTEQLSLALTWNRADIAKSEIFIYGQEWPHGALEDAMMKALEHDRCDFVKLLLENGVSMRKFLTIPRLENLYNSKQGPSNILHYILRDLRPHIAPGYVYTLHDIGMVINKLMGGAYRAFYTRRKFRPIYAKVMNKGQNMQSDSNFVKQYGNAMSLLAGALPSNANPCLFDYPFNELLIWAVLMKRHKMALLMWQHGEEALAKALVACKLYKAMAHEAAEDDMETEVYEELRSYGREFENIALEVLDYCYRQDDDQTQQLLTCELQNWSGQTCLSLAVAANHRALLAHPCSQIILADLWMGGLRTRKNTNMKVIMGLLCPPYILKMEFKSKEELQLMPQTTEEHLELENDDDDKSDSEKNLDGEALLQENFITRDTVVHENGKVLTDLDERNYAVYADHNLEKLPKNRELKFRKKLYEFYTAPITKFWSNSIAYLIFLIIFSYTVLVRMEQMPSWQEWMSIAFICSLGCEKLRELFSSEPVGLQQKFAVWSWNLWNPCDTAAVLVFIIGMFFRFRSATFEAGRVVYCVNCIYWYLRILNILSVNKYLGPLVTMMGKMVKNMIYFVVLLLIVLMSFGVSRQAILFPDKEPSWSIARDIFLEPYFMLYGEVYADKIDPPCGGEDEPECQIGRWVSPTIMSIYLLVANILLINLLIAVFNNIFNEVNAVAHQVWMFQRFTVVMEYEQKPILPPPFIIFCHIYLLFKYLRRKINGTEEIYDNGLKLFLDRDEMERLYDFEEDCVEGYFAEQETKLEQSTEERIKVTTERIEHLNQKVEDILNKEMLQSQMLQGMEVRMRKFGEQLQDLTVEFDEHVAKFNTPQGGGNSGGGTSDFHSSAAVLRERTVSETEPEDTLGQLLAPQQPSRRKTFVRSLTEVRPDAYIFDNGQHIEYRYNENEEEGDVASSVAGSRSQLSLARQRTKSTDSKTSVESDKTSDELSADDLAALSLDILRNRAAQKRRDSTGTVRRGSESGGVACEIRTPFAPKSHSYCHIFKKLGEDSSSSAAPGKPILPKRQFSQTQSEPETSDPPPSAAASASSTTLPGIGGGGAGSGGGISTISATSSSDNYNNAMERNVVTFHEPKIKVIPPTAASSRANLLMHMHTEYTSITDELESVCGLLSPPRSPGLLSPPRPEQSPPSGRKRHLSEMSNPEMAINFEKEHLRNAEESDYMVMENLIQRRYDEDDELDEITNDQPLNPALLKVVTETREFRVNSWPTRQLRRSGPAIESDQCPLGSIVDDFLLNSEPRRDSICSIDVKENRTVLKAHYVPSTAFVGSSSDSAEQRQDSTESGSSCTAAGDLVTTIHQTPSQQPPQRPSIVIDSSQLPIQRETIQKADSKGSLHMQSETMC